MNPADVAVLIVGLFIFALLGALLLLIQRAPKSAVAGPASTPGSATCCVRGCDNTGYHLIRYPDRMASVPLPVYRMCSRCTEEAVAMGWVEVA